MRGHFSGLNPAIRFLQEQAANKLMYSIKMIFRLN